MIENNEEINIIDEIEESNLTKITKKDDDEDPRNHIFSISVKIDAKLLDDLDDYIVSSHSSGDFTFQSRASILRYIIKNLIKNITIEKRWIRKKNKSKCDGRIISNGKTKKDLGFYSSLS